MPPFSFSMLFTAGMPLMLPTVLPTVVRGSLRRPSYLLIGIQQNNLDTIHYTLGVHRQLMDVLFLHMKLLLQQIASYLQGRARKKAGRGWATFGLQPGPVSTLGFPTVVDVGPPQQGRVSRGRVPMALCCLFV